jgi:Domain of unknown function (DUF4440)
MMKGWSVGVFAAVVALSLAPVSFAQNADGRKAVFSQLYTALRTAMRNHDQASVGAMLAPGFESYDASGKKESAEDMLDQVANLPDDPNRITDTEVESVETNGLTAKVVQHYTMSTRRAGPDGVPHRIEVSAVSDDVWTRESGSWRLLSTSTREVTMLKDGKVVVSNKR